MNGERRMIRLLQKQSPARIIALGFASVILLGSVLLILPCSVQESVALKYIDSLYTSTSAVCVTGLIVVDAGDTFTPIGQSFFGNAHSSGWPRSYLRGCRDYLGNEKEDELKRQEHNSGSLKFLYRKRDNSFLKSVCLRH